MIELIGWVAMLFTLLAVHYFANGDIKKGAWFQIVSGTTWSIVAVDGGIWSLVMLNTIILSRAAWALWRLK